MGFLRRARDGFRAFFQGLRLIHQAGLWSYVVLPALSTIGVGVLLACAVYFGADWLSRGLETRLWEYLVERFGVRSEVVRQVVNASGGILSALAALLALLVLFRALLSLLVIPFFGPLLEELEERLIGRRISTTLARDVSNALLGVWTSLRLSVFALLVGLLSLCLGPFSVLVNAVAQSYCLGRGSFDLVFEKASSDAAGRRALVRQFRAEILGLGLAFFLTLLIPIVGLVVAPVAALAGAALLFHASDKKTQNE